jgi:hypothetical protein
LPEEMWITRPVAINITKTLNVDHESSARIRPPNTFVQYLRPLTAGLRFLLN